MRHSTQATLISVFVLAALAQGPMALAKQTEIKVKLFGQTCLLTGPTKLRKEDLHNVHKSSPEQVPLVRSEAQADQVLAHFKGLKNVFPELRDYVQLSIKHTKALKAFYHALDQFKKDRNKEQFKKSIGKFAKARKLAEVDYAIRKALKKKKLDAETVFNIEQSFLDSIDPNPEAEFHRGIRKMGVVYHCSFEEE